MRGRCAYYAALIFVTGRRRASSALRATPETQTMKADIHPNYGKMTAVCSCGNVIETGSTLAQEVHLDVCSKCHPFYSGKQKVLDTGGRIDRFKKRFGSVGARR